MNVLIYILDSYLLDMLVHVTNDTLEEFRLNLEEYFIDKRIEKIIFQLEL